MYGEPDFMELTSLIFLRDVKHFEFNGVPLSPIRIMGRKKGRNQKGLNEVTMSQWHICSIHFLSHFFFICNWILRTYIKRILCLVSAKNITFKSSYNWFKIYILRPPQSVCANHTKLTLASWQGEKKGGKSDWVENKSNCSKRKLKFIKSRYYLKWKSWHVLDAT